MIIEAILPDPHRPGSTRVLVDGRLAWTIPADTLAALGVTAGVPVRGELSDALDRAADEEAAFRTALRALERRAHSERELAIKLQHRGHTAAAVPAALARLRRLGLLDDAAFARAFVTSRAERGRGPHRLRRDLARLGVARELVERAIAEATDGDADPLERPRQLVTRRARSLASLPLEARRRRLLAFLARRGYRGSDAVTLVADAIRAAGSADTQ